MEKAIGFAVIVGLFIFFSVLLYVNESKPDYCQESFEIVSGDNSISSTKKCSKDAKLLVEKQNDSKFLILKCVCQPEAFK